MALACGVPDEPGCTAADCEDRLELAFVRRDQKPFREGEYAVSVSLNGTEVREGHCTVAAGKALVCDADSGFDNARMTQGLLEFHVSIKAAPTSATAGLWRGDKLLGKHTVQPDYTIVTPGGIECGPVCYQSQELIEVSDSGR